MRTPFMVIALRLAGENARLRAELVESHTTTDQAIAGLKEALDLGQQIRRDADLLALMARDRDVALEFIRDAHRIDGIEQTA